MMVVAVAVIMMKMPQSVMCSKRSERLFGVDGSGTTGDGKGTQQDTRESSDSTTDSDSNAESVDDGANGEQRTGTRRSQNQC